MKKILFILTVLFSTSANAQTLSESDKAGILLMREEEKMARDIYQSLNDKWDQMPFVHISESEINHMARMIINKILCELCGLFSLRLEQDSEDWMDWQDGFK